MVIMNHIMKKKKKTEKKKEVVCGRLAYINQHALSQLLVLVKVNLCRFLATECKRLLVLPG